MPVAKRKRPTAAGDGAGGHVVREDVGIVGWGATGEDAAFLAGN